ncbi:MAG: Flagellar hook-length control protein FliK [Myxococcaceae bacterium]|nr:Flagellar hook-length control protein FliK [Myxococcaceae bacterium]
MRRLIFSFLLSAALSVGCGDDSDKGGGVGSDDASTGGGKGGKDGGVKSDGGKGGSTSPPSKYDGGGTGIVIKPTSDPFTKDATSASGLDQKTIDKLKQGGGSCTAKVLYPYNGTVFPAGLTPPTIMWEGATDAAYVKMTFANLDTLTYEAAGPARANGELNLDPDDWNEIVRRTQGTDLQVTLNTMSGGQVSSCPLTWRIAQGVMTGSVFFNTYNHPDKLGAGAVVRLTLGQPQSEIYLSYNGLPSIAGPCISCHSVSVNGSTMAASLHNYSPLSQSFKASSYPVQATPEPMPIADLPESTFGALTPDGESLLAMGNPDCTSGSNAFPRSPNNFPLVPGPAVAELHNTKTGEVIPTKGLNPGWFMWMPQFSPRGDKVVFNHAKIGADGRTDRRELAVMKYNEATQTFSDLQVLVSNEGPAPSIDYAPLPTGSFGAGGASGVNNCSPNTPSDIGAIPGGTCTGPCYPAWPFFTPDGEGIVYSMISEPDFLTAMPGRDTPAKSELWYLDIDTKQKVKLEVANKGLEKDDPLGNYYPTMLPVQVGGYYWLFWTSTRDWGHRDLSTTPAQAGANWFGGGAVLNANRKRIWVSAIKPRAVNEAGQEGFSDTSSPGFYLEGQTESGNVRAFATLNPCQQDGSDCTSGLDCCSGYCDIKNGKGSCVPQKMCSDVNEKCVEDTDCCPAPEGQQPRVCVGDYCGFIAL